MALTVAPCIFRAKVVDGKDIFKHSVFYDAMIKMMEYPDYIFKGGDLKKDHDRELRHGAVASVGMENLEQDASLDLLLQVQMLDSNTGSSRKAVF